MRFCGRAGALDGELVQERRRSARAERRLGRASAEHRQVGAFALLQQHDHDEEETGDDVKNVDDVDQELLLGCGCEGPRAPSTAPITVPNAG
jgi:hypothetical protein